MKARLNVLAIGGGHHFAHFLPVACELQRRGGLDVRIFVPDRREEPAIADLAEALDLPVPPIVPMALPGPVERLLPARLDKLGRLLGWSRALRRGAAILTAERTSTLLKRLPGACPPVVHIPHGAGDGAAGFEQRFRLFDRVIVAGPKDRARLVSEGLVDSPNCAVSGPVKVAAMLKVQAGRPRLFRNDRPTILYNPHFRDRLSSAAAFTRRLVSAIEKDGRFNLVVAPHVRMARNWTSEQRRAWEQFAIPELIVVDLGSSRSVDMTYTLGADLYIGDVSSQVYEFLVRPRPCLFVDAHGARWRDNPDYAMWQLGEVIRPDCDITAAIDRAFAAHAGFRPLQEDRLRQALHGIAWDREGQPGFPGGDPVAAAADLIEAFVHARSSRCEHSPSRGGPLPAGNLSSV